MAKLLLFDWDGTVLDTQRAKDISWLLAALAAKRQFDLAMCETLTTPEGIAHISELLAAYARELARVHQLAGMSRKDSATQVCEIFRLPHSPTALCEVREKIRRPLLDSPLFCKPCDGAPEFLALIGEFRPAVKAAVVSNTTSSDVRRQIAIFAVPDIFLFLECVGDAHDSDIADKDAKAAAYTTACARAGVSHSDAIAFEDSRSGIHSAQRSGLFTIGICRSPEEPLPADMCICPSLAVLTTQPVLNALVSRSPARCGDIIRAQLGASAWSAPAPDRAAPRRGRTNRTLQ